MSYRLLWGIWVALLCLRSLDTQAQAPTAYLIGAVRDAASDRYLTNASMTIRLRVVDLLPDGRRSLRPLGESQPLSMGNIDASGTFLAPVNLPGTNAYLAISVSAPGYDDLVNSLTLVRAGETNRLNFNLIRTAATPAELEVVNEKQAERKEKLYEEQSLTDPVEPEAPPAPKPDPAPAPRASAAATFNVPDQVYVSNLAGSGYTGMMDFDEYLAGNISAEMGDGFPFEALKVQAVASRSFALEQELRGVAANRGHAYTPTLGPKCLTAALNTTKIIILYNGNVIRAYYSARCNGDFTLNSEEGATSASCRVGGFGLGVLPWARARPCSGHVNCSQTSENCCQITVRGQPYYIYGHAVGMCQRGAQQFAGRDGHDWHRILTNFYTGVVIANAPGVAADSVVVVRSTVNVRQTPCGTVRTSATTGSLGVVVNGPERPVCSLASPNTYMTWWEVQFSNGTRGWVAEDFIQLTNAPFNVAVTITSQPTDQPFTIGAESYRTPRTFTWELGSAHNIQFESIITNAPDTRRRFSAWDDGATSSAYNRTVSMTDTNWQVSYVSEVLVTTSTNGNGSVTPVTDWQTIGTNLIFTATPQDGYRFVEWLGTGTGAYSGANNPVTIAINTPISQTARFVVAEVPLEILMEGATIRLNWAADAPTVTLQMTADLTAPINWQTVTNAPAVIGERREVVLEDILGQRFFRLRVD